MQEYGKIVFEYQKNNININKTEFGHMLKWVCDKVLQASNIAQAFSACGMCPFDYTASYAYKPVPPPKVADLKDEWTDSKSGDNSGTGSSHAEKKKYYIGYSIWFTMPFTLHILFKITRQLPFIYTRSTEPSH